MLETEADSTAVVDGVAILVIEIFVNAALYSPMTVPYLYAT